jgi:3-hydroxybutyryl-CoA dehydrogenase
MMEIKTIGIVGAGAMGHGIAQISSQMGCRVILCDIEEKFIKTGLRNVENNLTNAVSKGKITETVKNEVMGRINGTTEMKDLKGADFVIEAVFENIELKKKVFGELNNICGPEVILATNTSSMSITEIAAVTSRPYKVVGMHFFYPVPVMRLVEVIKGYSTSDETVKATLDVAKKMGKITIEVKKDTPGFVVNRILIPFLLEAINIVEQGIATPEDVDTAVKNALNHPMGPFELLDLSGIDTFYYVTEYFFKELNKEIKWVSPNILKNMVRAGRHGRKTGAGWYNYSK